MGKFVLANQSKSALGHTTTSYEGLPYPMRPLYHLLWRITLSHEAKTSMRPLSYPHLSKGQVSVGWKCVGQEERSRYINIYPYLHKVPSTYTVQYSNPLQTPGAPSFPHPTNVITLKRSSPAFLAYFLLQTHQGWAPILAFFPVL